MSCRNTVIRTISQQLVAHSGTAGFGRVGIECQVSLTSTPRLQSAPSRKFICPCHLSDYSSLLLPPGAVGLGAVVDLYAIATSRIILLFFFLPAPLVGLGALVAHPWPSASALPWFSPRAPSAPRLSSGLVVGRGVPALVFGAGSLGLMPPPSADGAVDPSRGLTGILVYCTLATASFGVLTRPANTDSPATRRGSRGARRSPRFGLTHPLHVYLRPPLLRLHLAHVRAEHGYGACPARAR